MYSVEFKVTFSWLVHFKSWFFRVRLDLLAWDTIKHDYLTPGSSAKLVRFFIAQRKNFFSNFRKTARKWLVIFKFFKIFNVAGLF